MSNALLNLAWEAKCGSLSEKLVLVSLADHVNGAETSCYPSIDRVCTRTGLAPRTVQGATKALAAADHITIEDQAGPHGVNLYHVHPRSYCTPAIPAGAQPTTPTPADDGKKPPVTPAATAPEPEEENPKGTRKTQNGSASRFDEFWKLYPKKVAKQAALKAWARLKPADGQAVLEDLPRRAASRDWRKDNGQFIPHPATFINGRRWEDAIPAAQAEAIRNANGSPRGPSRKQVCDRALEKSGPDKIGFATCWHDFWERREWKRKDGTPIDWEIELSESLSRQRSEDATP